MKSKQTKQVYFGDSTPDSMSHTIVVETVKTIIAIAEKELKIKAKDMQVLDVGSGWGEYAFEFEKRVKSVTAVEPYKRLYSTAIKNKAKRKSKVQFYNNRIENFETSKRFDLAISLTTIEHMPDAQESVDQVYRLLKDQGMFYVTAPNKLWPFEPHYRLLFLNWLPLSLANKYMQITGKGDSFDDSSYARTYFGMNKLFSHMPWNFRYWAPPSGDAIYIGLGSGAGIFSLMRKVGVWLVQRYTLFWIISKGFIVVAIKREQKKNKSNK